MSTRTKPTPLLMRTSELAAVVGVKPETIRRWQETNSHHIPAPAIKDAKATYYSREQAMRWAGMLARGELS